MQQELDAEETELPIHIIGVNSNGFESGNIEATTGVNLPWLQDTREELVWGSWDVVYRDVVVLDCGNMRQYTFNLTVNDLNDAEDYDALRQLLLDMACE